MLKQIIAVILISVALILTMPYAQQAVHALIAAHEFISKLLMDIFSGGQAGNMARNLIALLSLPILFGLIPAIIYWVIKRHWFPYFMEMVWIVWLVQMGALLILYKV